MTQAPALAHCNGGTGSLKPGIGGAVVFDAGLITAGLSLITPYLLPFAALIDAFVYEALTQCEQEPPALPVFDATDMSNLVGGVLNPNLHFTLDKIHQLLLHFAWDRFCRCSNGVVPVLEPLPPPTGSTSVTGNPQQACFQGTFTGTAPNLPAGSPISAAQDITTQLMPVAGDRLALPVPGQPDLVAYSKPAGVTRVEFVTKLGKVGSAPSDTTGNWPVLVWWDASNVFSGSKPFAVFTPSGPVSTGHYDIPVDANWYYVFNASTQTGSAPPVTIPCDCSTKVFCGGGATGGVEECCPPDPAIMVGIRNILNAIANLQLGGERLPVSWTDGVRHSSLREAGSFSINEAAIGIRIEVTRQPDFPHVLPGNPNFYWDMGFVTPIALTSPLRGWRVVFLNESFTLPQFTDSIGYTLLHGTEADIVELLPVLPP